MSRHQRDPHEMMQFHARIPHEKPTRTTQITKHYYKLTVVNRAKVR